MTKEEVAQALSDFDLFYLELIDDSMYHRGHAGNVNNGAHYRLIVVSDDFSNMDKVQRHRLLYNKFSKELRTEIHALSLKLMTVAEWKKYNEILGVD